MTHNITIVLDLHFSSVCDKLNIDIVSVHYNCDVWRAAAGRAEPGRAEPSRAKSGAAASWPAGAPFYLDLKYSVNFTM